MAFPRLDWLAVLATALSGCQSEDPAATTPEAGDASPSSPESPSPAAAGAGDLLTLTSEDVTLDGLVIQLR